MMTRRLCLFTVLFHAFLAEPCQCILSSGLHVKALAASLVVGVVSPYSTVAKPITSVLPTALTSMSEVSTVDLGKAPDHVDKLLADGKGVLDLSNLHQVDTLPGFHTTKHLLPVKTIHPVTANLLENDALWMNHMLDILGCLPTIAFAYVLVEFFIFRNVVFDDLETTPGGTGPNSVLSEVLSRASGRLIAISFISWVVLSMRF